MVKQLKIKSEISQINLLEDFIRISLHEFGIDDSFLMNLKLVLEEVVVNIISYAYSDDTEKDIEISLEHDSNLLKIRVEDSGIAFDPTKKKEPNINSTIEERPIGGLGIFLVKQLMTKVIYCRSQDKNILTMIKEIN